jgi:hypothetical protein
MGIVEIKQPVEINWNGGLEINWNGDSLRNGQSIQSAKYNFCLD